MQFPFTLVLLPGMLGTDDLFAPLLEVLPAEVRTRIISYPSDVILSLTNLLRFIEDQLSDEKDMLLLGESFSGPLALSYAADHPDRVRAVVVSAGFVRPPWPSWLRWLIHPFLVSIPLPLFLVRYFVAGWDASDEFAIWVRDALRKPSPNVMASRARQALTIDFVDALLRCRKPILYLAPTRDHMVRHHCLQTILKLHSNVHVAAIGGPHLILQRKPAESWTLIDRFAQSISKQQSDTKL